MRKPVLTLMCGIARCGKSTWVKRNKKDAVVICPDLVRSEIFGHQFFKNAEGFVWAFCKSMAILLLEQGKDVILDATNTVYSRRKEWLQVGEDCNAKIQIVWVQTSLKDCKKRNQKGQKTKEFLSKS